MSGRVERRFEGFHDVSERFVHIVMIIVKLTNGFGNNLFQYIAGRLLAEFHKQDIICEPILKNYYANYL